MNRLVNLLDESELACYLLLGLSIAATVVFGLVAIIATVCVFLAAPWWALVAFGSGLLCGAGAGLSAYLYSEFC